MTDPENATMRVTVTGAAGVIGIHVCRGMLAAKHHVVAADKVSRPDAPVPIHTIDLLDAQAVNNAVRGADAVVHLGNHSSYHSPKPRMIFGENVVMNMNVFQAAADAGAKKIVFASSVQALRYEERQDAPAPPLRPPYLPMDGSLPAEPVNPYGLSKQVGEVMLEYFARCHGVSGVALRLPGVVESRPPATDEPAMYCWPYLTIGDTVELILAILNRDLPGFRVYFPARPLLPPGVSSSDVIAKHYDRVPRRTTVEEQDSLVDNSQIQRETGWTPRDRPLP